MDVSELTDRLEALLRSARGVQEQAETVLQAAVHDQRESAPLARALVSQDEVSELFGALQLRANTTIEALDNGDYCADTRGQSPSQIVALGTGVCYRVVYSTRIFDEDAHLEATLSAIAQGEDARVSDHIPSRVLIRDRQEVLAIAKGYPDSSEFGFHSVHPAIVGYFCDVFDTVWKRALPVNEHRSDAVGVLTAEQIRLLRYLVLGRTDESIARSLGVSTRTVQRQIQTLQLRLGARGRFQLGLRVSRFFPSLGQEIVSQNDQEDPGDCDAGALSVMFSAPGSGR